MLNLSAISKYRNEIYGISAIWIVLFHATSGYGLDATFGFSFLEEIESWLRLSFGVDVFLFLSGISLYFSFSKRPSYDGFIRRRIGRIIPALILTWMIKWAVLTILGEHSMPWFIWQMTLIPFFVEGNSNGAWFISIIVFLYFIFPYVYSFIYSGVGASSAGKSGREALVALRTLLLLAFFSLVYWLAHKYDLEWFTKIEIGLGRVPLFVFGVYVGHLVKEGVPIKKWRAALIVALSVLWLLVLKCYVLIDWPWWWRLFSSYSGVFFSAVFAIVFAIISRIKLGEALCSAMRSVGSYSLELYGTHCILFRGLGILPAVTGNTLLMLLYGFVSFFYSWVCVRYFEPMITHATSVLSQKATDCFAGIGFVRARH